MRSFCLHVSVPCRLPLRSDLIEEVLDWARQQSQIAAVASFLAQ